MDNTQFAEKIKMLEGIIYKQNQLLFTAFTLTNPPELKGSSYTVEQSEKIQAAFEKYQESLGEMGIRKRK